MLQLSKSRAFSKEVRFLNPRSGKVLASFLFLYLALGCANESHSKAGLGTSGGDVQYASDASFYNQSMLRAFTGQKEKAVSLCWEWRDVAVSNGLIGGSQEKDNSYRGYARDRLQNIQDSITEWLNAAGVTTKVTYSWRGGNIGDCGNSNLPQGQISVYLFDTDSGLRAFSDARGYRFTAGRISAALLNQGNILILNRELLARHGQYARTVRHEVGHVMGLSDTYRDASGRSTNVTQQPNSVMCCTHSFDALQSDDIEGIRQLKSLIESGQSYNRSQFCGAGYEPYTPSDGRNQDPNDPHRMIYCRPSTR